MKICDYCLRAFKLHRSDVNELSKLLEAPVTAQHPPSADTGSPVKPIEKKAKLSDSPPLALSTDSFVCILCLGLNNESQIETIVCHILRHLDEENYRGVSTFSLAVHAPLSLKVRRMGMEHLVKHLRSGTPVPETEDTDDPESPQFVSYEYFVKDNLRTRIPLLVQEKCDRLSYDVNSPFLVTIKVQHATSEEDCTPVVSLALPKLHTKKRKSKFTISTVTVNEAVAALNLDDFRKNMFFLTSVNEHCAFEVEFFHKPIFVGGRYNKYSRVLSQTPWIVDGKRKSESSVEELICGKITSLVRSDSHKLSSSGREDVDVQMLGTGRPFLVECLNPRNISVSKEDLESVQQEINKSTTDVQVRNLMQVSKEATDIIRKTNEDKTKHYSALIWTPDEIAPEEIAFLNDVKLLEIAQKTPIRVLHRRSQAVRKRMIYRLKAEFLNSHNFTLCLSTQAGAYIKEFVHGDFGRTQPNLRLMMKQDVDILYLDVLEVELKWPV